MVPKERLEPKLAGVNPGRVGALLSPALPPSLVTVVLRPYTHQMQQRTSPFGYMWEVKEPAEMLIDFRRRVVEAVSLCLPT